MMIMFIKGKKAVQKALYTHTNTPTHIYKEFIVSLLYCWDVF